MKETHETPYAIRGFFGKYRPLSNYDTTPFEIDGVVFKSAEHAFHYFKTLDDEWRKQIYSAGSPSEARKLGRKCPMREDWNEVKPTIVYKILLSKFFQNENLKELLISTGFRYLEETNDWSDTYWGVCDGVGKNILGKLLMTVRFHLAQNIPLEERLILH